MSIFNRSNLIGGSASSGYQISRSVRLRSSASAYFNRTPASASNQKTWTWSGWVKRGALGTNQVFFNAGNNGFVVRLNETTNYLEVYNYSGAYQLQLVTSQVFRDPSAWYHIVVVLDTTQATSSNRAKVYVNGSQVTSFGTATYPSQNADLLVNGVNTHAIGVLISVGQYFDGYLTEINFIDGQALTPSSFGETDAVTGVWKPKKYTGTYGTNGFYLNFSDPSAATAAAIGKDYSGNGNNWTPNNISVTAGATYDSMLDTPTPYADGGNGRGNYAVLNPLRSSTGTTVTNGNLGVTTSSSTTGSILASIGMSSGKWYWECVQTATTVSSVTFIGIAQDNASLTNTIASTSTGYAYVNSGLKVNAGSPTAYGASFTNGDVIGVAFDADAGTITFYKNGTSQGVAYSSIPAGTYFPGISDNGTSETSSVTANFGQRPFAYTPPTGFKALNTQNLPEPTIKKGGEYFNAVTYTGDGVNGRTVSGVGFQPDLVWVKNRGSASYWHNFIDAVRGADRNIWSNSTAAEQLADPNGSVGSFIADGFTAKSGSTGIRNTNGSTESYVAWNWKAGGTPAVTNTAGSITSTVSAGVTQGFSVVTYTGTGANATVGHGLGVAPAMIVVKRRNSTQDWGVGHARMNNGVNPWNYFIPLNTTDLQTATAAAWNNTAPTSSVFTVGTGGNFNASGGTYVAYCFAEVPGFSRFGSYTGNGSADGPFVYLGFRPAYVMIKGSSFVSDWPIQDAARNPFNTTKNRLWANLSNAETVSTYDIDFLSNGFKVRTTNPDTNTNGGTIIFAAFAEVPFSVALAR